MYFTSGGDRAFESLMQGKPGFDHYDSGDAGAPEDCGDCRFYRPDWKYARKYGVSRASRKYNKSRSYIYFRRVRHDDSLQSLACRSRRPHSHPHQHTQEELKLIADMHRRNPKLGIVELWARMRKRGYTRTVESLWRVM